MGKGGDQGEEGLGDLAERRAGTQLEEFSCQHGIQRWFRAPWMVT